MSKGEGKLTGGDTLDASTAGETAYGGLGDALDVVTEDLAVAFGAAFAEAFSAFTTCEEERRVRVLVCREMNIDGVMNRVVCDLCEVVS